MKSTASVLSPVDALALAGKLLQRLTDEGRVVSLQAVREAIPLEPQPIFEGAKGTCQRHRKGRLFILIEEVESEGEVPASDPRPTVTESFQELLGRIERVANELMEEASDIGQGAPAHDLAARLSFWARQLRGEEKDG